MGTRMVFGGLRAALLLLFCFSFASGCQMAGAPTKAKLTEYREQLDDTGLTLPLAVENLNINASLPSGWICLGTQKTPLYTHSQWRSPSRRTAVGVTYVKMPLPLSTKTLVWFAMNEAGKKSSDGKIIRQWSDSLGREWFEAENNKYHMTGYVMTRGFDAWINYWGYRANEPKMDTETQLAGKALDTILPLSVVGAPRTESASAQ